MIEILSKDRGSYRLDEFMYKSDIGDLYKAVDIAENKTVLVKCLNDKFTSDNLFKGPGLVNLQSAKDVESHYLGRIEDIFEYHNRYYLVREYIDGTPILEKFGSSPVIYEEFLVYAKMAARGIYDLHQAGLIHGNIKPSNIFITTDKKVKFVDYSYPISFDIDNIDFEAEADINLQYYSPEVINGEPHNRDSDLYALGVIFTKILSEKFLYSGKTNKELLTAIVNDPPNFDMLKENAIPGESILLIEKLLWKDHSGRFASAERLLLTIDEIIKNKPSVITEEYYDKKIHSPRDYMMVSLLAIVAIIFWIMVVAFVK